MTDKKNGSFLKTRTKKLLFLGTLAFSLPAAAQSVVLKGPTRNFGYLVGDVIVTEAVITTKENDRIDRQSLPVPGPLNDSIELRSADVSETVSSKQRKTLVRLEYQSFFAPEQVMSAELPAYDVRFASSVAHVPAWPFHVSPLRVAQRSVDALADLHGNLAIAPVPERPAVEGLLTSSSIACLAAVVFAGMQGWLPGLHRNRQPFALAAHQIARMAPPTTDRALQALLNAFDATAGRHVFAEELEAFFLDHPPFGALRDKIIRVFELAKIYFFARPGALDERGPDLAEIVVLAKELKRAERRW